MLKINIDQQPTAAVVAIEGEVDLYSSPEVRKTILSLTKSKQPAIVLNLGEVTYMDSSGLATLVEGLQETGQYEGKFLLCSLRTEVRDVFELSHLDKVFEIFPTPEAAIESL